ncbi:MAG: DUF1576 domain-containing protein [Candidatus Metalachnospira sp.]|nr:DUF1576 domain-containing protein [Candidatus Metalachnospira sp.]
MAKNDWSKLYIGLFLYVFMFFVVSFLAASPIEIFNGLKTIVLSSDILITDYLELAGAGATFMNVGLVMLSTVLLMYLNKMPILSNNIVTIGLMSGFAFFGKNIFNMWFILLGTYLFCALRKEPMSKYLLQSFWASSLGPLISSTIFYGGNITVKGTVISVALGLIIGFVTPVLTGYTVRLQHGLNLYNGGFATGLMAMMLTPILKGFGYEFNAVSIWATKYNRLLSSALIMVGVVTIVCGYSHDEYAFGNYKNLLRRPGNPADDFLLLDGAGAVLINMGVNIIVATAVILAIGGDINGPTIGGILTIAGFSVKGKHVRNMIPVMLGIIISGVLRGDGAVVTPAAQLALLFGTTLAPVSGTYGFFAGVVAGFIHSCVVLYAGAGYSGVNLYNNGFAGGLVAIVMYSVLSEFFKPREYSEPSESMKPKPMAKPDLDLNDLYFHE